MLSEAKVKHHLSNFHHLEVFQEDASKESGDHLPPLGVKEIVKDNLTPLGDAKFECQICKQIFFRVTDAIGHQHSEDEKKNLRRKVGSISDDAQSEELCLNAVSAYLINSLLLMLFHALRSALSAGRW